MPADEITIEALRARLLRREPLAIAAKTSRQAAVAILLAERDRDTLALLIQRAVRAGDPWSGDMAFPGGHREPHDQDLGLTAARETLEEVGIDLREHCEEIGRLDDIHAHSDR